MVVVVPRLAERDPREPPDVARLVGGLEPAPAEEVADRVDRPGDVVEQEDADGPPQTSPPRKPYQPPISAQPMTAGISSERITVGRKSFAITRRPRSWTRSLAYRRLSARPTETNIQPTWAWQRPLIASKTPSPYPACGLCGSPSRSENWWCFRWSATHVTTSPWTPICAENRERVAHDRVRLEGAVGEEAVEPHRDPDAGQHVADEENRKLRRTDHPIPEQSDGEREPDQRRRDPDQVRDLVRAAQLADLGGGRGRRRHRSRSTSDVRPCNDLRQTRMDAGC